MADFKVGYFVGSLSSTSINRELSQVLISLAPEDLEFTVAVAKQLDPSPIAQRLAARGIDAELRTIRGSITLAGSRPSSVDSRSRQSQSTVASTVTVESPPSFV